MSRQDSNDYGNYKPGNVSQTIELTSDQSLSLSDWARLEQQPEDVIMGWVVDRGFVVVEEELNQRWINRDIRSSVLSSDYPDYE